MSDITRRDRDNDQSWLDVRDQSLSAEQSPNRPASVGEPHFPNPSRGGQSQNTNITINNAVSAAPVQFVAGRRGHGLFTRLLWFIFIGWWLSAVFIVLGYFFAATLILLPIGIWFLNRVPQAQTLRERGRAFTQQFKDGAWIVTESTTEQLSNIRS